MAEKLRVLVWTDAAGLHKPERPIAYPEGIHQVVADFLNQSGDFEAFPFAVVEDCFTPKALDAYQAVVLWGHGRPISVESQKAIVSQVESGKAGLVGLHSILSFRANPILAPRLFGQTEHYGWEDGVPMKYTVTKEHPIFEGVESFEVTDEAYYEPYGLVEGADVLLEMTVPDCETRQSRVFNFESGKYEVEEFKVAGLVTRAAWTYQVGKGRSFYLQPGHETDPTYRDTVVQGIICRAVKWVTPR
ncbi:MAG: ThuA domain-containing protein [Planctomycetes bacterium]|nr:ThuA domain-containing protein [Planctomycetota bacterium]